MSLTISVVRMPGGELDDRAMAVSDREFALTLDIDWDIHPYDFRLRRPMDSEKAVKWVRENVKSALAFAELTFGLGLMESDPALWMKFDW